MKILYHGISGGFKLQKHCWVYGRYIELVLVDNHTAPWEDEPMVGRMLGIVAEVGKCLSFKAEARLPR